MDALPALGRFEAQEHRFPLRTYFEDTDLTGVVYHANYVRFLERARSDMLTAVGVDQRAVHEAGEGAYAVREIGIRYRAPAYLNEDLVVVSRLAGLRPAAVAIQQRVMRGTLLLAEAEVEVVFVSPSGRPRRQPAHWIAAFEPFVWKGS